MDQLDNSQSHKHHNPRHIYFFFPTSPSFPQQRLHNSSSCSSTTSLSPLLSAALQLPFPRNTLLSVVTQSALQTSPNAARSLSTEILKSGALRNVLLYPKSKQNFGTASNPPSLLQHLRPFKLSVPSAETLISALSAKSAALTRCTTAPTLTRSPRSALCSVRANLPTYWPSDMAVCSGIRLDYFTGLRRTVLFFGLLLLFRYISWVTG